MLSRKTLLSLILGLSFLFVWSCEENTSSSQILKNTELKLGHSLTSNKLAYTFYVDSFIRENEVVYNEGRLNDLDDDVSIPAIWSSVMVRWGFRIKPSDAQPNPEVYWWQKTKVDVNTQNLYKTIVEEGHKARFTPMDFPEALLNEDEVEVFALAEINGFKISQSLPLPEDFKAKVLQASVIEGMIYDAQAAQDKRLVEGAAVFIGHKGTGNIYQGFSDKKGLYRVTVRRTGGFFMVVLRNGFVPYEADLNVVANLPNTNVALTKLSTGTSITAEKLYEVKPFGVISGSSSSSVNGRAVVVPDAIGVPGAFVVFYDRSTDQVTFVQTDGGGNFNTNLPAGVKDGADTTVSVTAGAYGYKASSGSRSIDRENSAKSILNLVSFTRDLSTGEQTKLAWGSGSTGGPSNLDKDGNEAPVKLKYTSSGVAVRLDLVATGPFVPASPSVVWRLNSDIVVADQSGLSATFTLNTERIYTISAGFKDVRKQTVVLTRKFDVSQNYDASAWVNVGAERRGEIPISANLHGFPNPTGYVWKLQKPGSSVWENIPDMNPQPSGASFNLPLDNLSIGVYKLSLNVTDAAGASVTGMGDVTITAKAPDAKRLDAPSRPVQGDRTGTTIETIWGGVKNADGYVIYWKKEGETAELRTKVGTDVRSYTLKGLIPNTRYIVEVQATSTTRNYLDSLRSAGGKGILITARGSLAKPEVTAVLQTSGEVLVTWSQVPNAEAYGIYYTPTDLEYDFPVSIEGVLTWWADSVDGVDEPWVVFTKLDKSLTSYTLPAQNLSQKYYVYVIATPNNNEEYGASYGRSRNGFYFVKP